MRITIACLVVLVLASPGWADTPSRGHVVVDALGVDARIGEKLIALVDRHDAELAKLQRERGELKSQLVASSRLDPKSLDGLLDATVANQRALAELDGRLLQRVRKLLPSPKAVQLLFLLSVTEPTVPAAMVSTAVCNPWTSMHRCN